jgi:hypothetical protein
MRDNQHCLMNFEIDDKRSVKCCVETITAHWFDAKALYSEMQQAGRTSSGSFWHVTQSFLNCISDFLTCTKEEFIKAWCSRCEENELRMIAYHCTRARCKESFLSRGILPIGKDIFEDFLTESFAAFPSFQLSENDKNSIVQAMMDDWLSAIRLTEQHAGPYFFLSCSRAKELDNDYLENGPEVWWCCIDAILRYCNAKGIQAPCTDRNLWRKVDAKNLNPFIIKCSIPFSVSFSQEYLTYVILISFFNYIDPDPDSSVDFCKEFCVRLDGKALDPKHIISFDIW